MKLVTICFLLCISGIASATDAIKAMQITPNREYVPLGVSTGKQDHSVSWFIERIETKPSETVKVWMCKVSPNKRPSCQSTTLNSPVPGNASNSK
ncbi:hypothetical protein [Motiliproteus sp. MSK22-1]|uniref:hypothetical protein n=1 Tax=Motiliproteus sp. MSK22-1 TaxID=1897630 RepID=UPI0011813C07|nr:hypothetical protein [Motiliproteus sp. MSK22-1]